MGDWLLLVAGFGFALLQFAVGKARKPIVNFQKLLSYTSCVSHLSYWLPSKREAPRIAIFAFPVAFRHWKCYYLHCFKESDSWDMVFDIPAVVQMTVGRFTRIG